MRASTLQMASRLWNNLRAFEQAEPSFLSFQTASVGGLSTINLSKNICPAVESRPTLMVSAQYSICDGIVSRGRGRRLAVFKTRCLRHEHCYYCLHRWNASLWDIDGD